jgi:dTDP-4-dehydro-6-deoxy-alpha-D-glucopyranose 2,3-dehydratase
MTARWMSDDAGAEPARSTTQLAWFRERLAQSQPDEPHDPQPVRMWLASLRAASPFAAHLIPLREVRGWGREEPTGNVVNPARSFFWIEGVRVDVGTTREVSTWDQPIFNQLEGGLLGLVARIRGGVVEFLVQAKAEPGNILTWQLSPTIQATASNLAQAHGGRRPRYAEFFNGEVPVRVVYRARQSEEGGRFWQKSNITEIVVIDEATKVTIDPQHDAWVTLSQLKALMLEDHSVNPFVKAIIAPL